MADAKPRILIVEDDPASSEMLLDMAEFGGYDADAVLTGQELVEVVPTIWRYAVVLLDLSLARAHTGFDEFLRGVLGLPPIVVFSARSPQEIREEAESIGAFAWLQKPASVGALLDAIGRAVRSRSGSGS